MYFTWQQKTPGTLPGYDSTVFIYQNGIIWSTPELVVVDPIEQHIEIDEYNNLNIFDVEKTEDGSYIVHYYKFKDRWEGFIIAESEWYGMMPVTKNYNNKLYAVYYIGLDDNNGDIYISKSDIIVSSENYNNNFKDFNIYPNPGNKNINIEFYTTEKKHVKLYIINLNGQLVKTLINEIKPPGEYRIIWNGKDKKGKEVNSGIYLIRLQAGMHTVTRSVEFIK